MRRRAGGRTAGRCAALALLVASALGTHQARAAVPTPGLGAPAADSLISRLIAAEDSRAVDSVGLAPILEALASTDVAVQRVAVRALGRLERESLAPRLIPMLAASAPVVRAEAANALAQTVAAMPGRDDDGGRRVAALERVTGALLARLTSEQEPAVRAALARALGRLPHRSPDDVRRAEEAIVGVVEALRTRGSGAPTAAMPEEVSREPLVEALRGLEWLVRTNVRRQTPSERSIRALRALAVDVPLRDGRAIQANDDIARVRRIALGALVSAGAVDSALLDVAQRDPDAQVRRLAAIGAGSAGAHGRAAVDRALADPDPMVRVEGVRAYGRTLQARDCGPLLRAVEDSVTRVALIAIDQAAAGCPETGALTDVLARVARASAAPDARAHWHRGAHALVALAKVAPARAAALVTAHARDSVWQVRMYAARAAGELRSTSLLRTLAADPSDNVREAAITALRRVEGHAADSVYIAQLAREDYQLILSAAKALEGSTRREEASAALLRALARLTAQERETSRDPRVAIIERLGALGDARAREALRAYLADFDPAVARAAAAAIVASGGQPPGIAPRRASAHAAPPTAAELAAISGARLRVTMAPASGGGSFELRLLPDEAPASVARIVRLAERGYYDGLTFHRVVANFVIQGGSPGANEYVGDGPFMRDELGERSHLRGTVGVSTRGRDTGDAQLFVNLVDNWRLDHDYTIVAVVTSGMSVVDGVLEGDVIERVTVLPSPVRR